MKAILLNPYLITIIMFIIVYSINKLINKKRALKLLYVINHIQYFEKRNSVFSYSNTDNIYNETCEWGFENRKSLTLPKLFGNDIKNGSIVFLDTDENKFLTYNEYVKLYHKFKKLYKLPFTSKLTNNNEFTQTIEQINDEKLCLTLNSYYVFNYDKYHNFFMITPNKSEISKLLDYLFYEHYIYDVNNIEITEKGLKYMNNVESSNSNKLFEILIDKLFSLI